jgi:hypothetical protein
MVKKRANTRNTGVNVRKRTGELIVFIFHFLSVIKKGRYFCCDIARFI